MFCLKYIFTLITATCTPMPHSNYIVSFYIKIVHAKNTAKSEKRLDF